MIVAIIIILTPLTDKWAWDVGCVANIDELASYSVVASMVVVELMVAQQCSGSWQEQCCSRAARQRGGS